MCYEFTSSAPFLFQIPIERRDRVFIDSIIERFWENIEYHELELE